MKILISGATGLIGRKLVETLVNRGQDQVLVLARNEKKAKKLLPDTVEIHEWKNPAADLIPEAALEGVEAVIHLAGEPIAEGRWTDNKKEKLWNSRVDATRNLVMSIEKSSSHNIGVVISSSAIGFYGNRHDEVLNEGSQKGEGYLAELCSRWEQEASSDILAGVRFVQLRTGIVLAKDGGALAKMLPPFKLGAGGRLGDGAQVMSWIHLQDMVNLIIFSMENDNIHGAVNATAPHPVSNIEFTKILAKVLRRPAVFPVPSFMLKIIFGEMASILLEGQRVIPEKLSQHNFSFTYGKLEDALNELLIVKKSVATLAEEA